MPIAAGNHSRLVTVAYDLFEKHAEASAAIIRSLLPLSPSFHVHNDPHQRVPPIFPVCHSSPSV